MLVSIALLFATAWPVATGLAESTPEKAIPLPQKSPPSPWNTKPGKDVWQ
jgi:hypothetical protein